MSAYSFPVLKNSSIIACLKELQIPLTIEELKNPTADKLKVVYENFMSVLMGVTREDFRQPHFGALDFLPHPELHDVSLTEMGFYKKLIRLMTSCGLHDCTLVHLVTPEYQQTRRILSALINFAKFREERRVLYQEFSDKTEQLLELKTRLEQESETQDGQLKQLKAAHASTIPLKKKLEEETSELEAELKKLNDDSKTIRESTRVIKQTIQELDDKIANDKFVILNHKSDCETLKAQIVRSPEKLKASLSDMEKRKQGDKEELAELNVKLRRLQSRLQGLDNLERTLTETVTSASELKANTDKAQDAAAQANKIGKTAKQLSENAQEQEAQGNYLQQQLDEAQDKLFKMQRKFEHQRLKTEQTLRDAENRQMELEFSAESERARMAHQTAVVEKKKREMEVMKAEHAEEIEQLRTKYSRFQQQLAQYHSTLLQSMAC